MKTSQAYINEYSFFDQVIECLESCENDIVSSVSNYNKKIRAIENRAFFENVVDADFLMEKEGQGVLATIGNAIINIIKTISDFLENFTKKIFGTVKKARSDEEIVTDMVKENPEYKDRIAEGIKKEWYTCHDIAKYEKDVMGLIAMLDKNAIDHQTFKDKLKKAAEDFESSAKPIVTIGATITALTGIIPALSKNAKNSSEVLDRTKGKLKDFKETLNKEYAKEEVTKKQAIFHALSDLVGITTKECREEEEGITKIGGLFHMLASKKSDHQDTMKQRDEDKKNKERENARNKYEDDQREKGRVQREHDAIDRKITKDTRKDILDNYANNRRDAAYMSNAKKHIDANVNNK